MNVISPEAMEAVLRRPKPGLPAQLEMAIVPRPGTVAYPDTPPDSVPAAVLILIYPRDGAPHLVFIRRPSASVHHKDQIAFPGGQTEGSETPVEAALREAEEEVGVRPSQVRVAGSLTPLYIPPSRYCVTPVVGLAAETPVFVPFLAEVEEILEVPLAHLLDPATVRRETWILERGEVSVPFYAFGRHKIWGATAMVLAEFLTLLRSAGL
jgi:8-oxo-dGTP pyrophosphatase MutT (NUDIX family)